MNIRLDKLLFNYTTNMSAYEVEANLDFRL